MHPEIMLSGRNLLALLLRRKSPKYTKNSAYFWSPTERKARDKNFKVGEPPRGLGTVRLLIATNAEALQAVRNSFFGISSTKSASTFCMARYACQ